jgi:hypothetical protein
VARLRGSRLGHEILATSNTSQIFIKWAFRAAKSFLISSILFLITSLKSHHISRDIVITWWQAADDRTPTFHPKNRHDAAR